MVIFAGIFKAAPARRMADNINAGEYAIEIIRVAQVSLANFTTVVGE